MNRNDRGAFFFLAFAVGLFLWSLTRPIDHLPERIATHFNASGIADDRMNKEAFRTSIAITAFSLGAFIVFLTSIIRFLPDQMLNLPRKEYWLAAERRKEFFGHLMDLGFILAGAEITLFGLLYREILRANEAANPQLDSVWTICLLPLAVIAAAVLRFYLKLRREPAQA